MKPIKRLFYSSLLGGISLGAVSVLLPLYLSKGFGESLTSIGLLFSAASLMLVILQIPAGFLADRFGRVNVMIAGSLLKAAAFSIYGGVKSTALFALGKGVEGSGSVMARVPGDSLLIEVSDKKRYSESFGNLVGYFSIGYVIGYFIAGTMAERIGFQASFFLLVLFELASIALILGISERRETTRVKFNFRKFFSKPSRILRIFSVCGFAIGFAECMDSAVTVLFLHDSLGASVAQVGLAMGACWLAYGVVLLKFGRIIDRRGRRSYYMMGLAIASACAFLLPHSGSIPVFVLLFAALGAGFGLLVPAARGIIAKHASRKYLSQDLGFVGIFEQLGPLIGLPVMGFMADNLGFASAFYLRGILLLVPAVIVYATLGKSDKGANA